MPTWMGNTGRVCALCTCGCVRGCVRVCVSVILCMRVMRACVGVCVCVCVLLLVLVRACESFPVWELNFNGLAIVKPDRGQFPNWISFFLNNEINTQVFQRRNSYWLKVEINQLIIKYTKQFYPKIHKDIMARMFGSQWGPKCSSRPIFSFKASLKKNFVSKYHHAIGD